jgi:hypothetical protein
MLSRIINTGAGLSKFSLYLSANTALFKQNRQNFSLFYSIVTKISSRHAPKHPADAVFRPARTINAAAA